MERTTINEAKEIFASYFFGPNELSGLSGIIKIDSQHLEKNLPEIHISRKRLKEIADDYILILGVPVLSDGEKLTINRLKFIFGCDPEKKQPCFYNQDWYMKEDFANKITLKHGWYLIKRRVINDTRSLLPMEYISKTKDSTFRLPSAILCAYTFFVCYLLNDGLILWENDYIWCDDRDHNGDQIYIGRYIDPAGMNKNGLSVHRHLSLTSSYGMIDIMNMP